MKVVPMLDIPPRLIITPYALVWLPGDPPRTGRGLFEETMDYALRAVRRRVASWGGKLRDTGWGAPGPVLAPRPVRVIARRG